MPHIVLSGGGGGKIRICYTARRKHGLLATANRLQKEGRPLQDVARELKVCAANLSKRAAQKVDRVNPLHTLFKNKKKAAHSGPLNQLKAIKDTLLLYIVKLHEHGVNINTFIATLRASYLLPKFRKKSFTVLCSAVKLFIIAHLMTYQMGTHTLQRPPANVNYMQFIYRIILGSNHNQHFVLNTQHHGPNAGLFLDQCQEHA